MDRQSWEPYTKSWKNWSDSDYKAKSKTSYTVAEYQWSKKKDRKFKKQHFKAKEAKLLKKFQEGSNGAIGEIFITDARGGNVLQTQPTSDWFQGDEGKFTEVANKANYFAGDVETDESTRLNGSQVSVPIWEGNKFLGVAVVTVQLEKIDLHK